MNTGLAQCLSFTNSFSVDTLEDEFCDVISKAQRGLRIATSTLAEQAGIDQPSARALRDGSWSAEALAAIAPVLRLRAEGLMRLARGLYRPDAVPLSGLTVLDTPAAMSGYPEMRVNAFLIVSDQSDEALLFDTGTDPSAVEKALNQQNKRLGAIFLTHAHWDHCDCLPDLRARWPEAKVYGPKDKRFAPHITLKDGDTRTHGNLIIEARETSGHAPQSLSFVIRGLEKPLVVVGDALFAGSIGGIPPDAYEAGLAAIRSQLLSLPSETVVAPGHGCLTTVGYEVAHNPFFPGGQWQP